jgi:hypothetical protein
MPSGSQRPNAHFQPAGRRLEVAVGLVCGAFGSGLAALVAFVIYLDLRRGRLDLEAAFLLITLAIAALAALLLVFAWRLLGNRGRSSDGGLLSPLGLRIGGVIFLAGPVSALLLAEPLQLLHASLSLAAAGACFSLARHREHHLAGELPPDP